VNYLEDILLEMSALLLLWRDIWAMQFGYLAQFRLAIWPKIVWSFGVKSDTKKGCPSQ
jgi:hypothetical protein